jgi:hypothetical protein
MVDVVLEVTPTGRNNKRRETESKKRERMNDGLALARLYARGAGHKERGNGGAWKAEEGRRREEA